MHGMLSSTEFQTRRHTYPLTKRTNGAKTLPDGSTLLVEDLTSSRLLMRPPTKKHIVALAGKWPDVFWVHEILLSLLRGGGPLAKASPRYAAGAKRHAAMVGYALARYMRNFAPRAPNFRVNPNNNYKKPRELRYLYRGIAANSALLAKLQRGMYDPGFLAFSTNRDRANDAAGAYGTRMKDRSNMKYVTLRISIKDIPKGTPWIWFRSGPYADFYRHVHITSEDLEEVLLPPGTLKITARIGDPQHDDYAVSYRPAPLLVSRYETLLMQTLLKNSPDTWAYGAALKRRKVS